MLLWSMMNDRAYLNKEDQARGQGDLKHAYEDEVVLMRMGVPEEYVRYQTKLVKCTVRGIKPPS